MRQLQVEGLALKEEYPTAGAQGSSVGPGQRGSGVERGTEGIDEEDGRREGHCQELGQDPTLATTQLARADEKASQRWKIHLDTAKTMVISRLHANFR